MKFRSIRQFLWYTIAGCVVVLIYVRYTRSAKTDLASLQSALPRHENVHVANIVLHQREDDADLPWYINYWLDTCHYNTGLVTCMLFIVTDRHITPQHQVQPPVTCRQATATVTPPPLSGNVKLIYLSNDDFQQLISDELWLDPTNIHGYKLADFKPLYGNLFQRYIPTDVYTHWAWCDPDVIQGPWAEHVNWSADVASFYADDSWLPPTLTGQLTILKNNKEMNHLWRVHPNVTNVLEAPDYHWFDEKMFGNLVFRKVAKESTREFLVQTVFHQHFGDVRNWRHFRNGKSGDQQYYQDKRTGLIHRVPAGKSTTIETASLYHVQYYKKNQDTRKRSICEQVHSTWQAGRDKMTITLCGNRNRGMSINNEIWPSNDCD